MSYRGGFVYITPSRGNNKIETDKMIIKQLRNRNTQRFDVSNLYPHIMDKRYKSLWDEIEELNKEGK